VQSLHLSSTANRQVKWFPFTFSDASGSLLLLSYVADNDDFLVLVAAGNDGAKPSPDGTVTSLCLL
jgi:hypothetical protein